VISSKALILPLASHFVSRCVRMAEFGDNDLKLAQSQVASILLARWV
jgi:hypothetical protein